MSPFLQKPGNVESPHFQVSIPKWKWNYLRILFVKTKKLRTITIATMALRSISPLVVHLKAIYTLPQRAAVSPISPFIGHHLTPPICTGGVTVKETPMNMTDLLPPLTPEHRDALKASIIEHGVSSPILVDQHGDLIDGFARLALCEELKINCPRFVQQFESDEHRMQVRVSLNVARRQLNTQQKRVVIEAYLKRDPAISNHYLGEMLGVSENTVKSVREELESTSQIAKLERFRGKDGKVRRKNRRILANNSREVERAKEFINELPEGHGILSVPASRKKVNLARTQPEVEGEDLWMPEIDDSVQILHCPFQELKEKAGIKTGSVQLVLTDPPYEGAWLEQWAALGEFAADVLKDGGLLVTHCGLHFLPEVLSSLCRHLTYRWTLSTSWAVAGNTQFVGGQSVLNKWVPIIVFSKGNPNFAKGFCDMIQFEGQEKGYHRWQQPVEIFQRLVKDFSASGDLIVDPCGGSFTTAVACSRLESRRRFIGCDIDEQCVNLGKKRLLEERPPIAQDSQSNNRITKLGLRIYSEDPKPIPFGYAERRQPNKDNRFQEVPARIRRADSLQTPSPH